MCVLRGKPQVRTKEQKAGASFFSVYARPLFFSLGRCGEFTVAAGGLFWRSRLVNGNARAAISRLLCLFFFIAFGKCC